MKTVLVTGSSGMLGKSVCEKFLSKNFDVISLKREDVDLTDSIRTLKYLSNLNIDLIVHCAAEVGGIQSNIDGGSKFFINNVMIDSSVLFAARELDIKNLIYIGSSCMYPANHNNPLKESDLLNGKLEPTNENYALAKIYGSELTKSISIVDKLDWRVFIASNLYGPHDHFESKKSHLISSIISKVVYAIDTQQNFIEMWGDGSPKREFTYVSDFAEWILYSSNKLSELPYMLNTGIGVDFTVLEYYKRVAKFLRWDGEIIPNRNMPNGNSRKLMDSSLARKSGWNPRTSIDQGIELTVSWYLNNRSKE
jgi:nucleoside-diphosphate-sugar epimerase